MTPSASRPEPPVRRVIASDGAVEAWGNGEAAWGDRYVVLGPDGSLAAQGSRLFRPAEGTLLACDAVRDHTLSGRVTAPSELRRGIR